VSFKLLGCELPEDGDQPQPIGTRRGEIYIGLICAFVDTERL